MRVRDAGADDAGGCVQIYAEYVRDTTITFETEVPSVAEMADRITAAQVKHEWLVLEESPGRLAGYAYAQQFKPRAAYQWSVETSIYLDRALHRRGGGRLLYSELLARLGRRGYRRAFAGVTQPNDASMAFHRTFGFEPAGLYRRVGWKHGGWCDVAWLELDLVAPEDELDPPGEIS
jgi:L-amino acid N-acyltransferase YncA